MYCKARPLNILESLQHEIITIECKLQKVDKISLTESEYIELLDAAKKAAPRLVEDIENFKFEGADIIVHPEFDLEETKRYVQSLTHETCD